MKMSVDNLTVYRLHPYNKGEVIETILDTLVIPDPRNHSILAKDLPLKGYTPSLGTSFSCHVRDIGVFIFLTKEEAQNYANSLTAFLTKSEAEAKLKELRGGENESVS